MVITRKTCINSVTYAAKLAEIKGSSNDLGVISGWNYLCVCFRICFCENFELVLLYITAKSVKVKVGVVGESDGSFFVRRCLIIYYKSIINYGVSNVCLEFTGEAALTVG